MNYRQTKQTDSLLLNLDFPAAKQHWKNHSIPEALSESSIPFDKGEHGKKVHWHPETLVSKLALRGSIEEDRFVISEKLFSISFKARVQVLEDWVHWELSASGTFSFFLTVVPLCISVRGCVLVVWNVMGAAISRARLALLRLFIRGDLAESVYIYIYIYIWEKNGTGFHATNTARTYPYAFFCLSRGACHRMNGVYTRRVKI